MTRGLIGSAKHAPRHDARAGAEEGSPESRSNVKPRIAE